MSKVIKHKFSGGCPLSKVTASNKKASVHHPENDKWHSDGGWREFKDGKEIKNRGKKFKPTISGEN